MRKKASVAMIGIAAFFVALVVWSLWPISRPDVQHQGDTAKQPSQEDRRTRGFSAADIRALIYQERANSRQDANSENSAIAERVMRFTLILVIVNAISAVILYWYAVLTKQSADAGTRTAKATEDALHIAERAYLAVAEVTWSSAAEMGFPVFVFRNTGRTPALNVLVQSWVCRGKRLPDVPEFPKAPELMRASLPVDGTIRAYIPDINWDKWNLPVGSFVYSVAEYTDIFGKRHWLSCIAERTDGAEGPFVIVSKPGYDYARDEEA